jgi:hypothetical protein
MRRARFSAFCHSSMARNCLGVVVCVQISISAEATAAGVSEEPDASTTHGQSATTS